MDVKRSECAVLPLVLTGRWYAMIESGVKREEYRADTPYWNKRISNWIDTAISLDPDVLGETVVEFRLGYAKDAPRMAFEVDEIYSPDANRYHHPEWGEPDSRHWVLKLGERVRLV